MTADFWEMRRVGNSPATSASVGSISITQHGEKPARFSFLKKVSIPRSLTFPSLCLFILFPVVEWDFARQIILSLFHSGGLFIVSRSYGWLDALRRPRKFSNTEASGATRNAADVVVNLLHTVHRPPTGSLGRLSRDGWDNRAANGKERTAKEVLSVVVLSIICPLGAFCLP